MCRLTGHFHLEVSIRHACDRGKEFFLNRNCSLRLFELARLPVRFDHVVRFVVNTNDYVTRAAEKSGVADCITDCVRLVIPQPARRQRQMALRGRESVSVSWRCEHRQHR